MESSPNTPSTPRHDGGQCLRAAIREMTRQMQEGAKASSNYALKLEGGDDCVLELCAGINDVLSAAHESLKDIRRKNNALALANSELKRSFENRSRTEAKLLDSEARVRAIVDCAADGIVTVDTEGNVIDFNAAACAIFGYSVSDVAGQPFAMLLDPSGGVVNLAATGLDAPPGRREYEGVRNDGSVFPLNVAFRSVQVREDVLYTASLRDMTEELAERSKQEQAQKLEAIGQLAAGIAHEINTPTQFVADNVRFLGESFECLVGMLDLVRDVVNAEEGEARKLAAAKLDSGAEEADLEFLVEEIPKAVRQSTDGLKSVAGIVRAMKEFSHPGSTRKSPIDIGRAIANTITVARNEWKYVAEIDVQCPPSLPSVWCLESELNQVMLNLIVNAAQAIAPDGEAPIAGKGKIWITAEQDGESVVLRVRDDGMGIPADVLGRVFDPFYTSKGVGKGTGQGLAIARSVIVDKHGGKIGVESEVGIGTTFTITLPWEVQEAA